MTTIGKFMFQGMATVCVLAVPFVTCVILFLMRLKLAHLKSIEQDIGKRNCS